METYVVNGTELTYDTFDADCIERWDQEINRVAKASEAPRPEGESPSEQIRRICRAMLDFFDAVCGEGTARTLFGERINVKSIYEGYGSFVKQVNAAMMDFAQTANELFSPKAPQNRAQKRAGKRE